MQYEEIAVIPPAQRAEIREKLWNYNLALLEDKNPQDLGVFVTDDAGNRVGALLAWTLGHWMNIDYLWVDEAFRGQKIGTSLLKRAELAAAKRGCQSVFVDTLQFQAPLFYEKMGYQQALVLSDYPITGKRFYYTKNL